MKKKIDYYDVCDASTIIMMCFAFFTLLWALIGISIIIFNGNDYFFLLIKYPLIILCWMVFISVMLMVKILI